MLNISPTKWKLNLLFYFVRSGLCPWYPGHRFHCSSLTEVAVAVKNHTNKNPLLQRSQTLSISDGSITGKWCLFSVPVSLGYSIHHSLPESKQRLRRKNPSTFWWHPDSSEVSSKNPTGFIRATNCSFVLCACFHSQSRLPKCWSWSCFHSWIIRIYYDLN